MRSPKMILIPDLAMASTSPQLWYYTLPATYLQYILAFMLLQEIGSSSRNLLNFKYIFCNDVEHNRFTEMDITPFFPTSRVSPASPLPLLASPKLKA
jgi:hypothetical protein